jgi:hypothetical protein
MIPKPSRQRFIGDFRVTGLRPTSAHSPDLRHVLRFLSHRLVSFFLRWNIPLDKMRAFSYVFPTDTDRANHAISIALRRLHDVLIRGRHRRRGSVQQAR